MGTQTCKQRALEVSGEPTRPVFLLYFLLAHFEAGTPTVEVCVLTLPPRSPFVGCLHCVPSFEGQLWVLASGEGTGLGAA